MNSIPISQMLFDIYKAMEKMPGQMWNYNTDRYGDFYCYIEQLTSILNIELTIDINNDWECRYIRFDKLTNELKIDGDIPNNQLIDRLRWMYIQLCLA